MMRPADTMAYHGETDGIGEPEGNAREERQSRPFLRDKPDVAKRCNRHEKVEERLREKQKIETDERWVKAENSRREQPSPRTKNAFA